MIIWIYIAGGLAAFIISAMATPVARGRARALGMMDYPAAHKAHARPTPLLGGCAILAGILVPSTLALALASVWAAYGPPEWLPRQAAIHLPGLARKAPMAAGILTGGFLLHVVGLIDDRKNLGPWLKLVAEIALALFVVLVCGVRVITAVGEPLSSIATVLWLLAIINAFNFLDNADGLAAGVGIICAAALLAAAAQLNQLFVSAALCVTLGAMLGFLPYNFPPAGIFMGDSGSLVIGYFLAVASCLTTYVRSGQTYYTYGIFVPLVLMAVPLYDLISVIILRIKARTSPLVGDRRHFSHRLMRRGFSVRATVLTVYLCTAGTAIAASLLPHVADNLGAVLVFAQTVIILLIIAMLESGGGKQ